MSNIAVCRTVPATPRLLIWQFFFKDIRILLILAFSYSILTTLAGVRIRPVAFGSFCKAEHPYLPRCSDMAASQSWRMTHVSPDHWLMFCSFGRCLICMGSGHVTRPTELRQDWSITPGTRQLFRWNTS